MEVAQPRRHVHSVAMDQPGLAHHDLGWFRRLLRRACEPAVPDLGRSVEGRHLPQPVPRQLHERAPPPPLWAHPQPPSRLPLRTFSRVLAVSRGSQDHRAPRYRTACLHYRQSLHQLQPQPVQHPPEAQVCHPVPRPYLDCPSRCLPILSQVSGRLSPVCRQAHGGEQRPYPSHEGALRCCSPQPWLEPHPRRIFPRRPWLALPRPLLEGPWLQQAPVPDIRIRKPPRRSPWPLRLEGPGLGSAQPAQPRSHPVACRAALHGVPHSALPPPHAPDGPPLPALHSQLRRSLPRRGARMARGHVHLLPRVRRRLQDVCPGREQLAPSDQQRRPAPHPLAHRPVPPSSGLHQHQGGVLQQARPLVRWPQVGRSWFRPSHDACDASPRPRAHSPRQPLLWPRSWRASLSQARCVLRRHQRQPVAPLRWRRHVRRRQHAALQLRAHSACLLHHARYQPPLAHVRYDLAVLDAQHRVPHLHLQQRHVELARSLPVPAELVRDWQAAARHSHIQRLLLRYREPRYLATLRRRWRVRRHQHAKVQVLGHSPDLHLAVWSRQPVGHPRFLLHVQHPASGLQGVLVSVGRQLCARLAVLAPLVRCRSHEGAAPQLWVPLQRCPHAHPRAYNQQLWPRLLWNDLIQRLAPVRLSWCLPPRQHGSLSVQPQRVVLLAGQG
mmetsp:Transcript_16589/g.39002  ORF Transcript_16589/g.39002 Transcript_16589/m.39002 type:complete len:668 (-) Transcript_16589:1100-3103(-)